METKEELYFRVTEDVPTVYRTETLKVGETYYVREDPYVDHDLDVDGPVVCIVAEKNVKHLDNEKIGVAHSVLYKDEFYENTTEVKPPS
jgi:hypothetical protein